MWPAATCLTATDTACTYSLFTERLKTTGYLSSQNHVQESSKYSCAHMCAHCVKQLYTQLYQYQYQYVSYGSRTRRIEIPKSWIRWNPTLKYEKFQTIWNCDRVVTRLWHYGLYIDKMERMETITNCHNSKPFWNFPTPPRILEFPRVVWLGAPRMAPRMRAARVLAEYYL